MCIKINLLLSKLPDVNIFYGGKTREHLFTSSCTVSAFPGGFDVGLFQDNKNLYQRFSSPKMTSFGSAELISTGFDFVKEFPNLKTSPIRSLFCASFFNFETNSERHRCRSLLFFLSMKRTSFSEFAISVDFTEE